MMFKIALVEDEANLSSLVSKYMLSEGYECVSFRTGEEAIKFINDKSISLWVLDIMLPGVVSGYDILKQIRSVNTKIPVIFTSARDQDIDRVMGLELGSDDYLSKPYSIRELMLRIKNMLARAYGKEDHVSNVEEINGYAVDFDKRIVTENGVNINLTSKEYDLLFFLLQNKTKAFSRDQILDEVWGSDYYGSDRVVDDLMRRLRQKMPNLSVETIYGFGYRLV
ncbi:MAG: response regulator transcription factor [Acholeplasmatales bacterium]|nr:response regulator transcription factor [Acholeplasmatales bacterium]